MAREFDQLFDEWSESYDSTVSGNDIEYVEVFHHYDKILEEVVKRSEGFVLEFGPGTGNLTEKLLKNGHRVYGVEPSSGMRKIAQAKLPSVPFVDGDFLVFPLPEEPIDTIVSTYAFHHLTDQQKDLAINNFSQLLEQKGKIVFADTVFETEEAKQSMIEDAIQKDFQRLANDLKTEYYTTIPVLKEIFENHGFQVEFTQQNQFVWLIEAIKK